jgi:hypothetical protein
MSFEYLKFCERTGRKNNILDLNYIFKKKEEERE